MDSYGLIHPKEKFWKFLRNKNKLKWFFEMQFKFYLSTNTENRVKIVSQKLLAKHY
jgi:hypothetical protein